MQSKKTSHTFRALSAALFCLAFLAFSGAARGQDTVTGAFQGTVFNSTNTSSIGGAAVEITSESTGVIYRLTTNANGIFYQGLLAPGWYSIRVSFPGYKSRILRREIRVSFTGEVVPVPVALDPEPPGTTTIPTTEPADDIRVEINTTDARRDASFRTEQLNTLPLGGATITRSFDELALLAPGVAPPPQTIGDVAGPGVGPGVGSAGQFAVNGLRSRANNFTVDGSDNNDEDIGVRRQGFVALIPQPIESVQEFQIITLLAPAQFGRNIGAQVNAVSKGGGNDVHGTLYGFFNSDKLNARTFFDTTNGNDSLALRTASGQAVLLDGQPFTVRNQSGGRDSFTAAQAGAVLGGPIVREKLFYFLSGEYEKINANQEKSFAVPTIEQRGAFRTGATGFFRDPITNTPLSQPVIPNGLSSAAIFSLFPFPNNPTGVYGANTFTQNLPASGRGGIFSGKLDYNFALSGRKQSFTARYNLTDDEKDIPAVGEAIYATVLSKIQTQNLSLFFDSQINAPESARLMFNQVRFSVGRTHLRFDEVRDPSLVASLRSPTTPFLLNTGLLLNLTQPASGGVPNTGPVIFQSFFTAPSGFQVTDTELLTGPLGQVKAAGFSSLGTDVYNFPQDRTNLTYQFADEFTVRTGGHSLVFGADIRLTDLDSDLPRLSRPLLTFNGVPRLIRQQNGTLRFPTVNDPNPILRPEDLLGLQVATDFLLTFNVDRPDSRVDLRYDQLNFYGQDTWRIRPELSLSYGLRYEYNTPVKEVNGLIENTFSDSRLSVVPGLTRFVEGRTRLYEPDLNNFAPRIGVAYSRDLFGSNRISVFRAGYGIFYDQILGAVVNQSRNVFPTFLTLNYGGLRCSTPTGCLPGEENGLSLINPANTQTGNNPVFLNAPGTVNIFNPALNLVDFIRADRAFFPNAITVTLPARDLDMPMAQHYSFTYEQQLNPRYVASLTYVGTHGRNLIRFETPNFGSGNTIVPTTFGFGALPVGNGLVFTPGASGVIINPPRPASDLGAVNLFSTTAGSDYNSLQAQFRGRFANPTKYANLLDFQVSYTLSKVEDDVSDVFDLAGAFALPQDSFDLAAERGPANFDVRHRLSYDVLYEFPKTDAGLLRWITDGLQIAGTGRFRTGQPYTVNSIIDVNLDGNLTDRLDNTGGLAITGNGRQPLRLETNSPLSLLAPFSQDGRVERNSFRAGKVVELDLSILKRWRFGPRALLFRTDIFNFINRANFGVPVRFLEAPGFGLATNTVTPGRRVQFSMKYVF